jgi:anaerobic selenocysteine-containing dehydrogenase
VSLNGAAIHLQVKPGHDAEILAAVIRLILVEELFDAEFVGAHVAGLEELRLRVEPFDLITVGQRAGTSPESLDELARTYASADRAYIMAGSGPSTSGPGTLVEYVVSISRPLRTMAARR